LISKSKGCRKVFSARMSNGKIGWGKKEALGGVPEPYPPTLALRGKELRRHIKVLEVKELASDHSLDSLL